MMDFNGSRGRTNNKRNSRSIIDRLKRSKVNKSEAPKWELEVVNTQPTHSILTGSVDSGKGVLLPSPTTTARENESEMGNRCPENRDGPALQDKSKEYPASCLLALGW